MGQRFQAYVNYGKSDEPGKPGDNLFAMHLQWCWGQYAIVRAHQLVDFLDGARENIFNPFGMGEHSRIGGSSFDGRRQDLYILRALTELNTVAATTVPGHDLMVEEIDHQNWLLKQGELKSIPTAIKLNPLMQDNNDGFLVIKATKDEIKYAFCRDTSAIEPVSAAEYLKGYEGEWWDYDAKTRGRIESMVEDLEKYPLLTKEEMTKIFDREYDKKLNIEGYKEPDKKLSKQKSLHDVVKEAKERAEKQQPSPGGQAKEKDSTKRSDPAR